MTMFFYVVPICEQSSIPQHWSPQKGFLNQPLRYRIIVLCDVTSVSQVGGIPARFCYLASLSCNRKENDV